MICPDCGKTTYIMQTGNFHGTVYRKRGCACGWSTISKEVVTDSWPTGKQDRRKLRRNRNRDRILELLADADNGLNMSELATFTGLSKACIRKHVAQCESIVNTRSPIGRPVYHIKGTEVTFHTLEEIEPPKPEPQRPHCRNCGRPFSPRKAEPCCSTTCLNAALRKKLI